VRQYRPTVGYPSDSLASCIRSNKLASNFLRCATRQVHAGKPYTNQNRTSTVVRRLYLSVIMWNRRRRHRLGSREATSWDGWGFTLRGRNRANAWYGEICQGDTRAD